ncbi:MAG: MBL fold metallo-hydrolase [Alistipes sp.]|nr:MBL fold metallo-hydrolase [Alistipes sp.]
MNIVKFVFNPLQENTFVVWDESLECIIIDAGNASAEEHDRLAAFIAEQKLKPVMAVNTHGHFDHILGVKFLKDKYGVKFALSAKDDYLRTTATESFSMFCSGKVESVPEIDIDLETIDSIHFGNTELKIIRTPGHTPGGVCLLHQQSQQMFTGDTLFRESIGRSDLPGGDYSTLMHSILENLIPLGDEITIYPGHSEKSTIGHESLYNPFVVEAINGEIRF